MTQHMNRPLLPLLLLAALSQALLGQVPQPGTVPVMPPPSDPSVPPPLPTTDPKMGTAPPAVVQPGTVLQQPVSRATQLMKYLPAGEAPGGVQVTATAARSISLSWTAPAGAIGYWIFQFGPGQTTYYRGGSMLTEAGTTITGLLPASSYNFKVSAVYPQEAQKAEGMSDPLTATTAAAPVPTGFSAAVTGRGQVSLSWDRLAGADGYRISRNDTTLLDIKPVNYYGGTSLATSAIDSVWPGTHRYQIQAVYRLAGSNPGPEVWSALSPAASVVIPASSKVRYCQTGAGSSSCAKPDGSSVTIAAGTLVRPGRVLP